MFTASIYIKVGTNAICNNQRQGPVKNLLNPLFHGYSTFFQIMEVIKLPLNFGNTENSIISCKYFTPSKQGDCATIFDFGLQMY